MRHAPRQSNACISTSTASSPRSSSKCIRTCAASPWASCRSQDAQHTCVIACSREAKLRGVKNVMNIEEARERCPDIILVPQSPDLYRRAHNTLLSEISAVIPDRCGQVHRRTDLPRRAIGSRRSARARLADQDNGSPTTSARSSPARSASPPIASSPRWRARRASRTATWSGIPNDMPGPLLKLDAARHSRHRRADGATACRASASRRWRTCSPRSPSTCASCGAT